MQESRTPDPFLYRLIGASIAGLALLAGVASGYMVFVRLPLFREIFKDFGTELPAATMMLLRAPWFPLVFPTIALCVGILSAVSGRRWIVALAAALILLALATSLLALYAIDAPFHALIRSVSGP